MHRLAVLSLILIMSASASEARICEHLFDSAPIDKIDPLQLPNKVTDFYEYESYFNSPNDPYVAGSVGVSPGRLIDITNTVGDARIIDRSQVLKSEPPKAKPLPKTWPEHFVAFLFGTPKPKPPVVTPLDKFSLTVHETIYGRNEAAAEPWEGPPLFHYEYPVVSTTTRYAKAKDIPLPIRGLRHDYFQNQLNAILAAVKLGSAHDVYDIESIINVHILTKRIFDYVAFELIDGKTYDARVLKFIERIQASGLGRQTKYNYIISRLIDDYIFLDNQVLGPQPPSNFSPERERIENIYYTLSPKERVTFMTSVSEAWPRGRDTTEPLTLKKIFLAEELAANPIQYQRARDRWATRP